MFNGNGNNRPGPAGNSGMVLSELKTLKERNKKLEDLLKAAEGNVRASSAPTVPHEEHKRMRMALLNLLVATENHFGPDKKPKGEMEKAMKAAEAIIRPVAVELAMAVVTAPAPVEIERATMVSNMPAAKAPRRLTVEDK